MIDYYIVGSRIRQYRIEKNITQEELAFQVETSAAYISNIERGIKKPSLQKLSEIAEVLQVTINDLIYSNPYTNNASYDHNLLYTISMFTPEKQEIITKSIAQIINTIISE